MSSDERPLGCYDQIAEQTPLALKPGADLIYRA
jgi:hypothetical protein